jgi:hypothetical protein
MFTVTFVICDVETVEKKTLKYKSTLDIGMEINYALSITLVEM